MVTARQNNERVILIDARAETESFMTEDDMGTGRIYKGKPSDDWPSDLPKEADCLGNHE